MKLLHTIAHHPVSLLFIGIVLVVTSSIEIIDTFDSGSVGSHHGIFVFGLWQLLKTLPELFHASELIDEASR